MGGVGCWGHCYGAVGYVSYWVVLFPVGICQLGIPSFLASIYQPGIIINSSLGYVLEIVPKAITGWQGRPWKALESPRSLVS